MSKVVYLCRLYIVRYNFIVRLFDLMKFENNMGTGIKIETIGMILNCLTYKNITGILRII